MSDNKKPIEQTCPKCGGDDLILRYYFKGQTRQNTYNDPVPKGFEGHVCWQESLHDQMFYVCRDCDYGWTGPSLAPTTTAPARTG